MKKIGLIGEKLSHSVSPELHALFGDYEYRLYEISPIDLPSFLNHCELDGMNVTIPYKKMVIPFCSALSAKAAKIGAVNTLLRVNDGWYGENTDYDGFAFLLKRAGLYDEISKQKTLILGSGGASAAAQAVIEDAGGETAVVSRGGILRYGNIEEQGDAAFLVNTTPVGMYPKMDASPLDLRRLPHLRAVVDVIYNPKMTILLRQAESLGIPAYGGFPMLVSQAKAAAELFSEKKIADEKIDAVLMKDLFFSCNDGNG